MSIYNTPQGQAARKPEELGARRAPSDSGPCVRHSPRVRQTVKKKGAFFFEKKGVLVVVAFGVMWGAR